jgi:hypothetical protein
MNSVSMTFFALLGASVLFSGCEINTCGRDDKDCRHEEPEPACPAGSVVIDETDGGADAYVWVVGDAASPDVVTVDAGPADTGVVANDASTSGACHVNGDCAIDEDCIQGTCLTRCRASCQCRVGEACMQGYCTSGQPVPQSCATDCDCLAGQSCIAQVCQ